MSPFVFVTIALLCLLWYELRPKWHSESKKVFWVSAAFLGSGYLILTLTSFGVPLPSPFAPIQFAVETLFGIN